MDTQAMHRHTGHENQLYGIRKVTLAEGKSRGCSAYEVHTAAGLQADILPDTGLDLGQVRYKGVNISFLSKNGYDSPTTFIPYESEFMNTFPGGMLYTCGLRTAGSGNRDDGGEYFPLHGRIHGVSAEGLCGRIEGDDIVVGGTLGESALFGHALRLTRRITIPKFGSEILLEDTLENLTPAAEEFMLLYHFNFGYPFLSKETRLILPENRQTRPRDDFAKEGLANALTFEDPVDNQPERVFFHSIPDATATVENPALGIAATLEWSGDTLPNLVEWRSMASGDYALGLEPANNEVMGRTAERQNGTLQTIDGFATVKTKLRLSLQSI